MTRHTVIRCALRRDNRYLVTYRSKDGTERQAISDTPHEEGRSVAVRDGEVVQ